MRAKTVRLMILVLSFLLALSACNSTPHISGTATRSGQSNDTPYTISRNEDLTYSYKIIANNGDILFSDDRSPREPKINQVSDHVLSVTIQAGTGRSTNWAVFCDVANAKTSETFHYVLGAQDSYVFYVEFEDGTHRLVVQDIFDSSVYYKTYPLQTCGTFADPAFELTFDGKGKATITHLTGTKTAVSQTSVTIYFP